MIWYPFTDFISCSLIEFYPNYERTLRESLRLLVGEEVERRVDIGMAKDGSGVGGDFLFCFCVLHFLRDFYLCSCTVRSPSYQTRTETPSSSD